MQVMTTNDGKGSPSILLEQAFEKFNQTSERLQQGYEALQKEVEYLRSQLDAKEEEIKKAEKLATLGQTAAAMAHEVRNPLGAIKLFLSLLKQDLSGNSASLKMLDEINKSISNIDNVVSNILHFSKEQKACFAPLNFHAMLLEQAAHFESGLGKTAKFNLELNGNPFVSGNEHGLRQVLYNLLLNALQATRFEGAIDVSFDSDETAARIAVSDNGPGIPADIMETLFEPFITTRNEGTGLGLAIVRQIVEQHGGTIKAENAPEGGACFEIVLPRKR
jgi:signal transduction histidine kinase